MEYTGRPTLPLHFRCSLNANLLTATTLCNPRGAICVCATRDLFLWLLSKLRFHLSLPLHCCGLIVYVFWCCVLPYGWVGLLGLFAFACVYPYVTIYSKYSIRALSFFVIWVYLFHNTPWVLFFRKLIFTFVSSVVCYTWHYILWKCFSRILKWKCGSFLVERMRRTTLTFV